MVHLVEQDGLIVLHADDGDLASHHENQLAFWGFKCQANSNHFVGPEGASPELLSKIIGFLARHNVPYCGDQRVQVLLSKRCEALSQLAAARARGSAFKEGLTAEAELTELTRFLRNAIHRPLKSHQIKAALHLLLTENAANFSVPGSGKTTVVLAAFEWLRRRGEVDALFVVGPPACFGPWRDEFYTVLGTLPSYELFAGGDVAARRSRYLVNRDTVADLYLTTFQTLQRDWEQVRLLFEQQGIRFFLVVDEAHYMKQLEGVWARAVLDIAEHATRRCVLTGTPFPRSYSDGFNLFDVLWPMSPAIPAEAREAIALYSHRNDVGRAAEVLHSCVGAFFYRVRKDELGLAPQVFEPPLCIQMNKYERTIYDAILHRIQDLSQRDFSRNHDLLIRLRRGRMIRLRQCLSYTRLLASAVTEYEEDLIANDPSLADIIMHYDQLERPAKIEALLSLVEQLVGRGEKVVVWSNFIASLEYLHESIEKMGFGVRLIFGGTPFQLRSVSDELTREEIVQQFVDPSSGIDVLIANPAACAESISLHKTCSHAVYYDLSYNCAQYLQSLDRIHRVGGSEERAAHYCFLQYADTIDSDILANVQVKARNMAAIVDRDYPVYAMDMFAEDEEQEAYGRLFGMGAAGV
jgi:SNF2 family DNA or RNA helicase